MRVDDTMQMSNNAVEMMAILEEKRILEESRAELERERERMVQEKVQWRERMEAELKAKMEEMMLQQALASAAIVETTNVTVDSPMTTTAPAEVPVKTKQPVEKEPTYRIVESAVSVELHETEQKPEPAIPVIETPMKPSVPSQDKWEIDTEVLPQTLTNSTDVNMWFSKKEQKHQKQAKQKPKIPENKYDRQYW